MEWVIKSIVDNHRVFERQHKNEPHALTLNAAAAEQKHFESGMEKNRKIHEG